MVEKINVNNDFDLIDCKQKFEISSSFRSICESRRLWHS